MLEDMLKHVRTYTVPALFALTSLFIAPAQAGYMDFTVESLQVTETGGC